ncbi:hypothetical protein KbCgl_26950 [Corynebacterium glutamicum]|nr:hypothetical protein KbCgl_26950 [Corynebacterium glutamicum]
MRTLPELGRNLPEPLELAMLYRVLGWNFQVRVVSPPQLEVLRPAQFSLV